MELVQQPGSVHDVTSEQLRQYQATHAERDYVLVDVRQPEEYQAGHLPGARLLPLGDLESHAEQLRELRDRTVVFYCRSGGRSARAAAWVQTSLNLPRIVNLLGGYSGYQGITLPDFPRLRLLDAAGSAPAQLALALDLEKGTFRFYRALVETFDQGPIAEVFTRLAAAELEHGRAVHALLERLQRDDPTGDVPAAGDFEATFASLPGELVEGGEPLPLLVARAAQLGKDGALGALELALQVEFAAYDLYKNVAELTPSRDARGALLELAEQEKRHAQGILRALAQTAVAAPPP